MLFQIAQSVFQKVQGLHANPVTMDLFSMVMFADRAAVSMVRNALHVLFLLATSAVRTMFLLVVFAKNVTPLIRSALVAVLLILAPNVMQASLLSEANVLHARASTTPVVQFVMLISVPTACRRSVHNVRKALRQSSWMVPLFATPAVSWMRTVPLAVRSNA